MFIYIAWSMKMLALKKLLNMYNYDKSISNIS